MSSAREKFGSVIFALLVVTSMFVGVVAVSGSATAAVTSVSATNAPVVGGDVTVTAGVDSGETVTVENEVDGDVVNSITVTDGGDNDESSTDGEIEVTLSAGKTADGSSTVRVTDSDGTEMTDTYGTANYEVNVLDDALHGTTSDIEGEIIRYDGPGGTLLADNVNVDYSLVDTTGTEIASGDTATGEFLITRTFDDEPPASNNGERKSDLDYPSDANTEPSYVVYVKEDPGNNNPGASSDDNDGSDIVPVRLDVSASPSSSDLTYGETADVTGSILDGEGNGVADYKFAVRSTGNDVAEDSQVKERSSTTASNGEFGFTMVFNDAGEWSYGTDVGGESNANDYIEYGTFTVDTVTADVTLSAEGDSARNFKETYTATVADGDGNAIDLSGSGNYEGYVTIVGEFAASGVPSSDSPPTPTTDSSDLDNFGISTGTFLRAADTDGDGDVNQIHLATDSSGELEFTATPTSDTVTAQLQNDLGSRTDTSLDDLVGGVEETTIDTPENLPDFEGQASLETTAPDPVNIRNYDIEDPQTNEDFTTSTSIFEDAGPDAVTVLPLAQTTTDRIQSSADTDYRTGSDLNSDLDGLTQYRVTFEARDENGDFIVPSTAADETGEAEIMSEIVVTGAGVDGSIVASDETVSATSDSVNVVSASFDDTNDEYTLIVRPTEVTSPDEQFSVRLVDVDDNSDRVETDTEGLQVTKFEVGGETVESVSPGTSIDVSATVRTDESQAVNNGRVRLSQTRNTDGDPEIETVDKGDVDARTALSNIDGGAYEFSGIDVGPRGIDTNGDGIGDAVSQLSFTAYQYNDADTNGDVDLEQDEVTNATVETLDVAFDDSLQVDYRADLTSTYSGVNSSSGEFTLTRGVEYDELAFELTDAAGDPVDLTEGLNDQDVALDSLAEEGLVYISVPDQTPDDEDSIDEVVLELRFDTTVAETDGDAASDPANGLYIVEDVEIATDDATPSDAGLVTGSEGDLFTFTGELDQSASTYSLYVETPDRSQGTAADEGDFTVANANIETEVTGVVGSNIGDGTSWSDLTHDADPTTDAGPDPFTLPDGTTAGDIGTITAGVERTYRVRATVTDALGTPFDGADDDKKRLVYVGYSGVNDDKDRLLEADDSTDGLSAKHQFVQTEDVDTDPTAKGEILGLYGLVGPTEQRYDEVDVQNEDGRFMFDLAVDSLGEAKSFAPEYYVHVGTGTAAQLDTGAESRYDDNLGFSEVSTGPAATREVVEVYGRNGADLPTNEETGNEALAKDVENQLRVEAFPADADDFVLPDGQEFAFGDDDPKSETTVITSTKLNSSQDVQLATEGYGSGQVGFFSVTPTGTGDGVMDLVTSEREFPTREPVPVQDTDGDEVEFDVFDSNLQLDIDLSSTTVTTGDNVTATVTQASNSESLENVQVTLVDPDGTAIASTITDADGEATFALGDDAAAGTYSVQAGPAGFEPASSDLQVAGTRPLEIVGGSLNAPDSAQANSTVEVSAVVNNTGQVETNETVEFRFDLNQDDVLASDEVLKTQDVSVSADSTKTVTFDVNTSGVSSGTYAHGVFTADDQATTEITLEETDTGVPPLPGFTNAPANDDGNATDLEDVNGDGSVDLGDVQALYSALDSDVVQNNKPAFDFNGDGSVNLGDVQALYDYQEA